MNRISITINGRTVYWELPGEDLAIILEYLVASIGPAKED